MFVLTDATILHADLDAFYASVEQRDDPRLAGRPVIVGGGVVLAASYPARACGVRTAMNVRQARRLCPAAIVVPPRMRAYEQASRAVFEVFENTTPCVEALSIDEAFLQVGGLRRIAGSPETIATRLRHQVRREVGLPLSVGVARTKFLAKVASSVAKPDGLLVVAPEHELAFLHPLDVRMLWGVGAVTAGRLRAEGITTVGQVARRDERRLADIVGSGPARKLRALARNEDPRPVDTRTRRRSIGAQHALGRAEPTSRELEATLVGLLDRLARRLRRADRHCRTVVLRLRFGDYTRATRSHTLHESTDSTEVIRRVARGLLTDAYELIRTRGITLIGVCLTNLVPAVPAQLPLPLEPAGELDRALDQVRDRFGSRSVTRANQLGRSEPITVPLLPD